MSEEQTDIWRRVYTRMRADRRIMALSRPTPNGLSLWYELICGEQTGVIPGLFKIGERAMAEQLGWPLHAGEVSLYEAKSFPEGLPKGFREAFAEVAAQGLVKADWEHRLVYVRNAVKVNKPSNPNVVKGWRLHWRSLPECALKDEAARDLKSLLEGFGEGFAKAFAEVSGTLGANQEERERERSGSKKGGNARAKDAARQEPPPPPPPVETMADARALLIGTEAKLELFEHWQSEHHRVWKSDKVLVPPTAALEAAGKVLVHAGGDMAVAKRAVTVLVETREGFWAKQKNALWLLTDARDFERARLSTGAKEKSRGLAF